MKISFSWLYTKANIIHKETEKTTKRLSPSAIVTFLRKYKIKLKRVQRTKQENKEKYAPELKKLKNHSSTQV